MKTLKTLAIALFALVGASTAANAATTFLATDDFVGISFWLISMGMLAATAFFFMEQANVATQWRKSVNVAGLVTGIAFIHYMYMRAVWVETGDSPTVYRYIDWLITVPLQLIEFYLILSAVRKVDSGIFWRIFIGSLVMLIGGYLGEAGFINAMLGFIIGMAGWIYILYEIFSGEAGKAVSKSGNKALVTAFGALRMIVTVGWAIYPLGYVFGYLTGGIDANSLNVIYNLADFINKIAFGVIIWSCAVAKSGNKALVTAFGALRMIVTVGWAIYPLGYIFGYLTGNRW
jgi:bacteriorhodopsin